MFFWQRLQDRTSTTWRQHFPVRTAQWFFRTETLEAKYERDILKLDINLNVDVTYDDFTPQGLDLGPRYIADQFVSGKLTSQKYKDLFYRSGQYLFGNVNINQ